MIIKKLLSKLFFLFSRTNLIIKNYKLDKSYKYVWGMKKSGKYLRSSEKREKIIYLEDGFIHSYGSKKSLTPLSISCDRNGVFYDRKSNSELFSHINKDLSEDNILRARQIINLWKEYSISKYNFANSIDPPNEPYILLVDQTYGDLSISYGGANESSFQDMFDFASKNWPDHKILLKIHPDVIKSLKNGCINKNNYNKKNVIVIDKLGQINNLIKNSSAVCVVTSQIGFEALIYGKEVHVFGNPFYSGFGLTVEHNNFDFSEVKKKVLIEQLVFGTLVMFLKYLDPRTMKNCEVEEIMEFIKMNRDISEFFPVNLQAIDLTPWKARQINRFIYQATEKKVGFFKGFEKTMKNIVVWGKKYNTDKLIPKVENFISAEDGFVRSVGLGGDLFPPLSLLFDKEGIHYDASKKSRLEDLLQNRLLTEQELARSRKLIKLIIDLKVSKYNLKLKNLMRLPNNAFKKEIIVVLGQVETDNSIFYGVPNDTIPKTNFALVSQARKDFPEAYIIYKPHPDLESGLRIAGSSEAYIREIVDYVAYKTSLENIFKKVDRVVVFTSLGGFEALIRGIPVTTYGLPFYAGWGLTDDKLHDHKWVKRRKRILNIEELVYISLIEYPFYYSLRYKCFTNIEGIIEELDFNKSNYKNIEQILFKNWGLLKDFLITKKNK